MQIITPSTQEFKIRQEGARVVLIYNGQRIVSMPWDAALQLAQAITAQARKAEETTKADQIALDQAILLRKGIPIGLTDNKDIQEMAAVEAAYNKRIRLALPGGVKSQEHVGTPAIIRHKPKKG